MLWLLVEQSPQPWGTHSKQGPMQAIIVVGIGAAVVLLAVCQALLCYGVV
jgi:hypothetical protein